MNINDLLVKDVMIMDLQAIDKQGVINEMVQKLYDQGRISDINVYKDGILAREAQDPVLSCLNFFYIFSVFLLHLLILTRTCWVCTFPQYMVLYVKID